MFVNGSNLCVYFSNLNEFKMMIFVILCWGSFVFL
jgi:hypothetical protein